MSRNPAGTMAVRTSNQAYARQVASEQPLDNAVALFNPEHPGLSCCNAASEVAIEPLGAAPEAVFEQVQTFFAQRGLTCRAWTPAAIQPAETLERLLTPHGFVCAESLALLRVPDRTGPADARLRVLAARAMRRASTAVLSQRFAADGPASAEQVDVHLSRFDDPRYDGFVALLDDEPVGFVAVHEVGEIGRIRDLFVTEPRRRSGVGAALMNYAIATAQRWLLQPICIEVPVENAAARALATKLGFEEAGVLVRFELRAESREETP